MKNKFNIGDFVCSGNRVFTVERILLEDRVIFYSEENGTCVDERLLKLYVPPKPKRKIVFLEWVKVDGTKVFNCIAWNTVDPSDAFMRWKPTGERREIFLEEEEV